jgi:hypothetical protein
MEGHFSSGRSSGLDERASRVLCACRTGARPRKRSAPVRRQADQGSVAPVGRYEAEGVTRDRYPTHGRERQVRGHQQFTGRRKFPEKLDPDLGRLLRVVFEAVLPFGVIERDRKHRVTRERQPLAAGCQADNAVPRGVAAGAADNHPRRDLVPLFELQQPAPVLVQETLAFEFQDRFHSRESSFAALQGNSSRTALTTS